jgi:ferrous iron transport protein B
VFDARKVRGLLKLKNAIIRTKSNQADNYTTTLDVNRVFGAIISEVNQVRGINNDYASFLSLCGYDMGNKIEQKVKISVLLKDSELIIDRLQAKETVRRYKSIDVIISKCIKIIEAKGKYRVTEIIDNILIHPFFGYCIFLLILFLMFQAVFQWSSLPMDLIDGLFTN